MAPWIALVPRKESSRTRFEGSCLFLGEDYFAAKTRTSIRCTPMLALLCSMLTLTYRARVEANVCRSPRRVAIFVFLLMSTTRDHVWPSSDVSTVYWYDRCPSQYVKTCTPVISVGCPRSI